MIMKVVSAHSGNNDSDDHFSIQLDIQDGDIVCPSLSSAVATAATATATTRTIIKPTRMDAHKMMSCQACCKALLPFRKATDLLSHDDVFWANAAVAWDCEDGGFLEILRLVHERENDIHIPKGLTREIVDTTTRKLRDLRTKLMEAGLLHHEEQNFTAESVEAARIVAPFDADEVLVGRLLGNGGFSSVSAIQGFALAPRLARRPLSHNEELSRKYLTEHANVHPLSSDWLSSSAGKSNTCCCCCCARCARCSARPVPTLATTQEDLFDSNSSMYGDPFARYAMKHLRPSLLDQSHEKFHRAAVDLVLEGQLLMVLDHPNIVSIRGWSADGPQAYQSGVPSDYFLIIDRLPQTLQDTMGVWRQKLTKYRHRWRRATRRHDLQTAIAGWFRRSSTATSTTLNDPKTKSRPHNYVLKLQSVLLEQLKTALGVASAIFYMHSKRIIHRDIKSSNIGFDMHGEVKLFDLGLARLLPRIKSDGGDEDTALSHRETFYMSRVGTRFYMSPEVIRKEPYGTPADVYSLGVVLWEIFALSSPRDFYKMQRETYEREQKKNKKGEPLLDFPTLRRQLKDGQAGQWLPMCDCWPEAIRTLIRTCMSDNVNERPTMEHVCSVLNDEMIHASAFATLPCSNLDVPRRRSTFRLDLSKLQIASMMGNNNNVNNNSSDGDHDVMKDHPDKGNDDDDDDVCCGTSTTTNVTAIGADVPIRVTNMVLQHLDSV